jgi:hypothetical protein
LSRCAAPVTLPSESRASSVTSKFMSGGALRRAEPAFVGMAGTVNSCVLRNFIAEGLRATQLGLCDWHRKILAVLHVFPALAGFSERGVRKMKLPVQKTIWKLGRPWGGGSACSPVAAFVAAWARICVA